MKRFRRLFVAVLALVLCTSLLLVGCSQAQSPGSKASSSTNAANDTFTFAQGADPRGLDPARVDDLESAKVIVNVYEGLTRYAPDTTQVEPSLAETWTLSPDGLKYTFKLRQGVKFQDGTDFNADAVKFNIDRQLPPKADDNMPYASFCFGTVKEVKVIDPYTVEIDLTQKNTAFLANLAMAMAAPMVSPKAIQDSGNNSVMDNPVGTGPYKFVKWNKGENVVLVRNDDYWGEKAKIKNIVFRIIADNSARVLALNNGEVDMIDGIDATDVKEVQGGGNKLYEAPGMNVNYMAFNTTTPTFKDPEARKAVSEAVNRDELVKSLYQGYSEVASTILPTFMPGYDASVKQVAYDPTAAKAAIGKLGIKKIHMITYSNARPYNPMTGAALATAVQGYLQKVGVECTIDTYDWTTYKDKVKAGDYDAAFYGWIGDNGDPDNFLNLLSDKDPNLNLARWQDPAYTALIKQALATPNGPARDALYGQCEQYAAARSPWLIFSHAKAMAAYRPNVSGFVYHVTGTIFLSKAEKK